MYQITIKVERFTKTPDEGSVLTDVSFVRLDPMDAFTQAINHLERIINVEMDEDETWV